MCCTFIFSCIMAMVLNFSIFSIIQIFIFKFVITNITDFCIFIWFLQLFCYKIHFILFNINYQWMCALLKIRKAFPYNLYLRIYILLFYALKWWYCRQWETEWNMFTYFCCEWVFNIIFTHSNIFWLTFKTCINNKWHFTRFLILISF